MEIDAALTTEKLNEQKKEIIFEGNTYTIDEFCEKHHISRSAYYSRLQQGIPINKTNSIQPALDFRGIEYPSTAAMCRHFKVDPQTYRDRLARGWTLKESLLGKKRNKKQPNKSELMESRKRRNATKSDSYWEHVEGLDKEVENGKEKLYNKKS